MQVIHSVSEMQAASDGLRAGGYTVCAVPTMGFLHEGHASLIRRAVREADRVVVSLFVNPTQFGASEDLASYPRDFDRDGELVGRSGGDILFAPTAREMYPTGYATYVNVEGLSDILEGASRPSHFRGVSTVVTKLLCAIRPHAAVFGQKDAQQTLVIRRLAQDLNLGVKILVSPTVRDPDGLAQSSRNIYLKPEERRQSTVLFRALQEVDRRFRGGERNALLLRGAAVGMIARSPLARLDYLEIRDAKTLAPLVEVSGDALAVAAVRFGKARLIDNHLLRV